MGKHYRRFVSHRHLELSLFFIEHTKKKKKKKKYIQLTSNISCKQMGCSRYWVNENTIEKIRYHYFYY